MLPFCSCKTRITVFPYLTGKAFSWVFSYWVRSIFWDSSTKSMRRETKALAPRGNRQGRGRAAPALGIRHLYRAESRLRDHQPTGWCLSQQGPRPGKAVAELETPYSITGAGGWPQAELKWAPGASGGAHQGLLVPTSQVQVKLLHNYPKVTTLKTTQWCKSHPNHSSPHARHELPCHGATSPI